MKKATIALLAGLAATFALLSKQTLASGGVLTSDAVRAFADSIVSSFKLNVDPAMVVRIASIESSFNPSAIRYEPHIGDASAGLMQTLLSTAQWLAKDMGYGHFGVPSLNRLFEPQASIYFGASYLDYLADYRKSPRSEEWIVRSYNGGPGRTGSATDNYWRKYLAAKERLG